MQTLATTDAHRHPEPLARRMCALMTGWPVQTILHPLDLRAFAPVETEMAREFLGLPPDKKLVVFGALGGGRNYVKGFDLLLEALGHLREQRDDLKLVVFGQGEPREPLDIGFPVHYTGYLHDDLSLRMVYSAAGVMVVPSRMEAFGQTASEAHACGTPVVAFDATGLRDIVTHQQTGYLAQPYDPADLAQGITWTLTHNPAPESPLSQAARAKAEREYDPERVAGEYVRVYREAMGEGRD